MEDNTTFFQARIAVLEDLNRILQDTLARQMVQLEEARAQIRDLTKES